MSATDILVIGSAHLDVLAGFDDRGQEKATDKIGSGVSFGFGGTALNVATWLQECGHRPYLLTALNTSSFAGQAILDAMRAGGLSRRYVLDDGELPDGAFVALVHKGDLRSAVSCTRVDESRKLAGRLEKILTRFSWAVFDCNLSTGVIGLIAEVCRRRSIHAIGAATSDTKAGRLQAILPHGVFALCMNRREASVLSASLEIADNAWDELRNRLKADTMIITDAASGWYLIQKDKDVAHYDPPPGIVPVTTLGSGDATCAGLIHALIRQLPVEEEINRMVVQSLRSRLPTKFAERTSPEAMRRFVHKRRAVHRFLAMLAFVAVVTLTWFIEHILAWLLALVLDP